MLALTTKRREGKKRRGGRYTGKKRGGRMNETRTGGRLLGWDRLGPWLFKSAQRYQFTKVSVLLGSPEGSALWGEDELFPYRPCLVIFFLLVSHRKH